MKYLISGMWHFMVQKYPALFIALLFLSTTCISAQDASNDSLINLDKSSNKEVLDTFNFNPSYHSPHKATLYSAIFPGLGQIYNKQIWKAPIIYVAFGAMTYFAIDNNNKYQEYRLEYFRILSYKEEYGSLEGFNYSTAGGKYGGEKGVVKNKDNYKRWRDLDIIGIFAIYALNIIEADVSAHFYSYDVSEDLSMKVEPVLMQGPLISNVAGLRLSLKF